VDVPGGTVTVTLTEQGTALLTGPAVLVAAGEVDRSVIPESGD
jgi:diaminopimelate epimerase